MFYLAQSRDRRASGSFRTWDGQVIDGSPVFDWAVGKTIEYVLNWCRKNSWKISVKQEGKTSELLDIS